MAKSYRQAKAVIFPQDEDFGLVAVEAQAAGTPVVAYRAGGALETVMDGKTGIFFEKQTPKSLTEAIKRLEKIRLNPNDLIKNAKRFSVDRFKKEFLDTVRRNV